MPNQSMNSGTRAKEGIGISALTSGRKKLSIARKRAIRMPSGMPDDHRKAKAEHHPVHGEGGMLDDAAIGDHLEERFRDGRNCRQQGRREITAARKGLVDGRCDGERDRSADERAVTLSVFSHAVTIPQRTTV